MVMVPKPDAVRVGDLRPIGLMATLYRLWAAARLPLAREWLIGWTPELLGGRRGVCADTAALAGASRAQVALAVEAG